MNNSAIKLIGKVIAGIVFLGGVILTIWILANGSVDSYVEQGLEYPDTPVAIGLWLGIIAGAIALIVALGAGIFSIATNVKSKLPFLISIVVMAVIGFVAYALAGSETAPYAHIDLGEEGVTEGVSKFSGFMLNFFYILLGILILAVIATILRGLMLKFKK